VSSTLAWFGLALAATTVLAAWLYRAIWLARLGPGRTPNGFGALLAPALVAASWLGATSASLQWSLAAVAVVTFVYWLDDLRELGAWLRVGLAFATGLAIAAIYLGSAGAPVLLLVAVALLAGLVNVATVNIVNFQDGADLNLATFVLLTAVLLAAFTGAPAEWLPLAVACLAFIGAFACFNVRPNTLYLGDSGSFAFGSLLTILAVAFVSGMRMPPPEAALPGMLPLVDTAFVTATRIRIRQKFTTRHYFHLYQRLQRDHGGFAYLLPQLVNVLLCLGAAELLQLAGVERIASVMIVALPVSLAVFLLWRRCFVTGEPGPPGAREART
jgi:UDP-N-acetylmuramyl pentapeptide phosphotransferase/UDP-N-acetylglucosamine-1-phosphate transferase